MPTPTKTPAAIHLKQVETAIEKCQESLSALLSVVRETPDYEETRDLAGSLGQRIIALRRSFGMTQASLAVAAGMPQSQVNKIERGGHNCTIPVLLRVARALKVRPGDLLDGLEQTT